MKSGHKANHHRKHRETGGTNLAAEDLKSKPERYNESKVENEAEERKSGGRAKKHGMMMEGGKSKGHAGRKPRKQGGGTYSDSNPFTSARKGTPPSGRKMEDME